MAAHVRTSKIASAISTSREMSLFAASLLASLAMSAACLSLSVVVTTFTKTGETLELPCVWVAFSLFVFPMPWLLPLLFAALGIGGCDAAGGGVCGTDEA